MDVLLSIKPRYVQSILDGEKRYEFRKKIFRRPSLSRVLIYSSSPVKKIVASFEIGDILDEHPVDLWENVKDYAGIDDRDFFDYFAGKSRAFAIEIQDLREFPEPIDPREAFPGFVPPQSYCYVDKVKLEE